MCTSDLSKAEMAANPELIVTFTCTSQTWLSSETTMPHEPVTFTFWSCTWLLPFAMPMPEKMEGSELTLKPKTLIPREPAIESTYNLFSGFVAGCCIVAPDWPLRVRDRKSVVEGKRG